MIDRFIFFPRKDISYYGDLWKGFEIYLSISQQQLQGWLVKASEFKQAPFIIYYGGNAEDISIKLSYLQHDEEQPISWLLMNYRGFGKSSNKPSQAGLFDDALAIYDYVINDLHIHPDQIYLMGRSIGSSIASYVASQRKAAGLILVTPFDSLVNFAPKFLRFFIKTYLAKYFNTQKYLETVPYHILVIAAGEDEVIPRIHLENLINKFKDQLTVVEIANADHQNIADFPEYDLAIRKYIQETAGH